MVTTTTLPPATFTVDQSVARVSFPDGAVVQIPNPASDRDAVMRAVAVRAGRFGPCACRC